MRNGESDGTLILLYFPNLLIVFQLLAVAVEVKPCCCHQVESS
jgi:hypothetical protein